MISLPSAHLSTNMAGDNRSYVESNATTASQVSVPSSANGSTPTVKANAEMVEKEFQSLKREREIYAMEKKVLLDLLNAHCDEIDAVNSTKWQLEK